MPTGGGTIPGDQTYSFDAIPGDSDVLQEDSNGLENFDWSTILMGESGGQDDFLELLKWTIPEFGDNSAGIPS